MNKVRRVHFHKIRHHVKKHKRTILATIVSLCMIGCAILFIFWYTYPTVAVEEGEIENHEEDLSHVVLEPEPIATSTVATTPASTTSPVVRQTPPQSKTPSTIATSSSSTIPQYVLLAFDGSKSVSMLNETLEFERQMRNKGKPLSFTYFINAAYFLSSANSTLYQGPRQAAGVSNIGFSANASDIPLRVKAFNEAMLEGNEIGSHTTGHFDGSSWSYAEWKQEFDSFDSIISHIPQNNPLASTTIPLFTPQNIIGFRAPNLGVNSSMYKILKDYNFTYDASGVGRMSDWPTKDVNGIWHIPLATIRIGAAQKPTISMDYSLWVLQSHAKEEAKKGTALWDSYFNDVKNSYVTYFNNNYLGTRAPVVIGHHFSKWNDGVYWEAMKSLAEDVCGKPDVKCVTYKEFVDYLNTKDVPAAVATR